MKKILIFIFLLAIAGSCQKKKNQYALNNVVPRDFLTEEVYDRLVVEIVYVEGYKPKNETIEATVDFLNQRLHKSNGIITKIREIPAGEYSAYTVEEIKKIEEKYRSEFPKKNVLTAFIFFADKGFVEDTESSKVLGIAYAPTSMTIFEKTIQDYSGGFSQPSRYVLETAVTHHEFGHLFGLVNNGSPMQSNHQDSDHGHHCNVEGCLMYYATETSDIVGNLIGSDVPELDAKCIADLQANGGK